MVTLLQKVLQLYAARELTQGVAAGVGAGDELVHRVLAADEEQWDELLLEVRGRISLLVCAFLCFVPVWLVCEGTCARVFVILLGGNGSVVRLRAACCFACCGQAVKRPRVRCTQRTASPRQPCTPRCSLLNPWRVPHHLPLPPTTLVPPAHPVEITRRAFTPAT